MLPLIFLSEGFFNEKDRLSIFVSLSLYYKPEETMNNIFRSLEEF